jgi:hypothetical protein
VQCGARKKESDLERFGGTKKNDDDDEMNNKTRNPGVAAV